MSSERRTVSRSRATSQGKDSLSRPTSSALGGKFDVPVKAMLTDELELEFRQFALRNGYGSLSDCLRELIIVALRGGEYLSDLHRARIGALAKNLTNSKFGGVR